MTFLASNEREQRQALQVGGMGAGVFDVGGPATFEGFGTATGLGIGRGLATTGGVLLEVARLTPTYRLQEGLSELLGTSEQFRENERIQDEAIRGAIDYYRPDPATTGWAGQISYGIGATLLPAVVGTVAAGPIGGAALAGGAVGTGTFYDMTGEGVDRRAALGAAGIDAAVTAVGVFMPASLGGSLALKAGTGAVLNAGLGAGQRYAMGEYMRSAGYGEIAARYDAMDATAIATDVILGAAFGMLPGGRAREVPQSAVDAAMVQQQVRHAELDTAPGVPVDRASLTAHVRAVDAAEAALLRGEPVRIDAAVRGARFAPKPDAPAPEVAALVQQLDNLGFGQLVGDIRELEAELQGRGRTFDEDALPDVAAIPRAEAAQRTVAEAAPAPRVEIVPADQGVSEIRSADGQLVGNLLVDDTPEALTIRGIELEPDARGQGIDSGIYRQLADQAIGSGRVLASDGEVSADAARRYDGLERLGYTVERNAAARPLPDGKLVTPDGSPVFTVTRGPEPTAGAAQPTIGARAEGSHPADREVDQVAAEALGDRPDMEIATDAGMVKATDAMAAADELVDRATIDSAAYQAAVNCFLRNG